MEFDIKRFCQIHWIFEVSTNSNSASFLFNSTNIWAQTFYILFTENAELKNVWFEVFGIKWFIKCLFLVKYFQEIIKKISESMQKSMLSTL